MATQTPAAPADVIEPPGGVLDPETSSADDYDDSDSAIGSDDSRSSLQSLTSSITNYVYKNGRRYAAFREGRYPLPNDEMECDRNDFLQHIYGMLFGGRLIFAPISDSPRRILDIGTGTGIWAMNVADAYPSAEVKGTDLSPIQPTWVPPNLSFEIDDAESTWTFKRKFDLIHFQNMNGAISNWKKLFKQIYDNLEPGGFIECKECEVQARSDDDSIPKSSALRIWEEKCMQACATLGMPMDAPLYVKKMIEEAGFVDVVERLYKLPMNTWPKDPEYKEIGRYQFAQYMDALKPYALGLLVEVLGWTVEEMEVFLVGVRQDIANRNYHGYHVVHVITGRKPFDHEKT
ncbi:hypothetical protein VTO42DRAFT_452 [Malbranchea cinnamomea]